jgi:hypothetical protein
MFQNVIWIGVLVKSIINVTLNRDFKVHCFLAEQTWEESVIAVSKACNSLVAESFVFTVIREHEKHEH